MKFLLAVQTPLDVQEPSTSLHIKVNHSATNISNYEWGTIECTKVYVNNRSGWSDLYLSKHFFTQKKKKKAEQDVAKVALGHISKKIRDEGCPLIYDVCYIMIVNL